MTSTADPTTDSTAAVLDGLRSKAAEAHRAEVDKLRLTVVWAVLNEVDPDSDHANHGFFGDQPIPVAGEGAPLVAEFAAMELAAALGMSTDAGTTYLGRVLELRYRLPRLWAKLEEGRLPVWRAFRIADHTMTLPVAGAAHVDRREWCGNPNANITIKPVVDLADHIHVEAYEEPDRLKEQNALVDAHCVLPHCTKRAERCDTDHVIPHARDGTTCSCNTAPFVSTASPREDP